MNDATNSTGRALRTWQTMGYDIGKIRKLRGGIRCPMRALQAALVGRGAPDYLYSPETLRKLYLRGLLGLPRTIVSEAFWAPTKVYPITAAGRAAFVKGVL